MDRVSKASGRHNRRIQIMNVARRTTIERIEDPSRVNRSHRAVNNTENHSENFPLSSLYFYESMDDLKEDITSFNKFSSLLEEDLKDIEEKSKEDDSVENLSAMVINLRKIISKYNSHIYLLKKLDLAFGGTNVRNIYVFLSSKHDSMAKLGLHVNQNMFIEFNEVVFKKAMAAKNSNEYFTNWLFNPSDGFLKNLFDHFKKVKFSSEKSAEGLFMDTSV